MPRLQATALRSSFRALTLLTPCLVLLAGGPIAQDRPRAARQLPVASGQQLLSKSVTDSANETFDDWAATARKAGTSAWAAYRTFATAAIARVHALRPGVPVGVKVTYDGLTKTAPTLAVSLNGLADQVLTTYYPLRPDFTVRPPRVSRGDMNRLAGL